MHKYPVVMVTGASRGMGAHVVRWLAKTGCGVTMIARSFEALADLAPEVNKLGGAAYPIELDVSDHDACRQAVKSTLARFGRLDALVNNAGILEPIAPIARADVDQWHYNILVNLMGPFHMVSAAIEAIRGKQGRVVNLSSGAARNAISGWSAYCAAKAALTHFTRVLAAEEPDITAVSLRPGVVDTDMQTLIRRKGRGAMTTEKVTYFENLKSAGKLEPPAIPARAIAWLALHTPKTWSGRFLEYDDPDISGPAQTVFGVHF